MLSDIPAAGHVYLYICFCTHTYHTRAHVCTHTVQAQQLLTICREYIQGLSMEMARKEMPKVHYIISL